MARRSTAVQRELPRPLIVNREALPPPGDAALAEAAKLLSKEMLHMLEADATAFPPKGAPEGVKKRKPVRPMEPEALSHAAELLAAEVGAIALMSSPPMWLPSH